MDISHPDYYPTYSHAERIADAAAHVLGIVLGLGASIHVSALAIDTSTAPIAVIIYCISIMSSFIASALYHFPPSKLWQPVFRRADHAAIFLKIAGTYTPLVALIGGGFSYFILALVWIIAIGGIVWKLFFWSTPNWRSTLLYLTLGWLSIALAWPFVKTMPWASTLLVTIGGLTYTLGVIFYRWDNLRFSVAIWHGFVLVASACFLGAINIAILHQSI